MEKYNLPKGWKYQVFDKNENPIAKYYSALTDYGEMIKYSDIINPKNSNMFSTKIAIFLRTFINSQAK